MKKTQHENSFRQITRWILMTFIAFVSLTACTNHNLDSDNTDGLVMQDGEYEGVGEGRSGTITVSINVQDHKITTIKILSQSESKFAYTCEKEIIDCVLSKQGVDGVDAVSGATITSTGMLQAITMAINAAKGISKEDTKYTDGKCDVVVIGAGGAGLSAAVEAAQSGASVIVLEKEGIMGGNTQYSTGGINAAETSAQKALGIKDSRQLHFDDTMEGGHYLNDTSLVRSLVNNAAATVDWLTGFGADLSDVGLMAGSSVPRTHRPKGGSAIGPHLMKVLKQTATASGVEIRTHNTVEDILSKNGKVNGVSVKCADGSTYTLSSKVVIIATGGFGANNKMVASYRSDLAGFGTTNHKGATGDAFAWVRKWDVGLVQMNQIQTHPTVDVNNSIMITEAVRGNGAILVNSEGKRFVNEMQTRDVVSKAILAQNGGTAFLVFDQQVRKSLSAIETYANQGLLTQGNTWKDLSASTHIPSSVLEETINGYNNFQKQGEDKDFGRSAVQMPLSLLTSPYYIIEVKPAVHHTMGGLRVNVSMCVLSSQGNAIPGLFAAGEVTGGIHGGNRLGGNAVADIVVNGKIAGASAVKYIGKTPK